MTPPASADHGRGFRLSFVVALLAMLAPFSIDTYLPSFPDIGKEFQAADWQLQQTLSLYLLAFAITTLVYGPLSDAYGRRSVIFGTLALYTVSSIGCVFASDIHWLLVMRIGQGLSASGAVVVGRAIIRDAFTGARAQKVMSQVMLFFSLAPAVAPIIGGYLHDAFGWRSVFWFLTALAVLLIGATLWMLPETLASTGRHSPHPVSIARAYVGALKHRRFMLLVFATAISFGGLFLYISGSPAVLYQHLGYGADQFGFLFVPLVVGLMTGAFTSGRLAGRYTHEQAVMLGFFVMLGAASINLLVQAFCAPTIWTVVPPMVMYSTGLSIAMPNISLLALDCLPSRRGLAAAVQGFVQMVVMAVVAGALVPSVSDKMWTFAAGVFGLVLVAFVLWALYRPSIPPGEAHAP